MAQFNTVYLIYSLSALVLAGILATVFTSLRFTGDAGLPRLIERTQKHAVRLVFWLNRWDLLCKTSRLLLTLTAIVTFICFYLAVADHSPLVIGLLLFVFSILYMFVARIVPFVLSESYADRISLTVLPVMGGLTMLMYPVVWPMQRLEDRLLHHAMSASDDDDRPSAEDEIRSLIEEADEERLEEEEREIIRSVFEFGDTVAREIMTPRIDIKGVKDSFTVAECIEQVKEATHSRFPVYHENIDDVVGMVHVKDLLKYAASGENEMPVSQVAKRIEYVPETMPLNDLLQLMKQSRSQIVLVVDEYGGTEGLVTMEDIIEELVGEIEDEFDLKEKELQQRPDGTLYVQARIPVYELNETLNTKLPESEEYDSLGGYIFSVLGRIPRPGESVEAPGFQLRIHSASERQVQIVHMIPKEESE